jgi:hypothetical protein
VGSFLGKGGQKVMTLWRLAVASEGADGAVGADDQSAAPETTSLEDVVLGYLAAGRGTAGLQLN